MNILQKIRAKVHHTAHACDQCGSTEQITDVHGVVRCKTCARPALDSVMRMERK